jgi:hypothetical protein
MVNNRLSVSILLAATVTCNVIQLAPFSNTY